MATRKLSKRTRVSIIIAISTAFFVFAFKTSSLALYADAIHYVCIDLRVFAEESCIDRLLTRNLQLNDLLGYVVTLVAIVVSERSGSPQELSFGWQRSTLLGAFFNGSFLFALALTLPFYMVRTTEFLKDLDGRLIEFGAEHNHGHGHGHSHSHGHGHGHGHGHEHEHSKQTDEVPRGDHHHRHDLTSPCKKGGDAELLKNGGTTTSSATVLNLPSPKASCVDIEADGTTSPIAATDSHSEHRHIVHIGKAPLGDLNMLAAKFHVLGDIAGNLGVMIAAAIIQYVRPDTTNEFDPKYYADPAISLGIAALIFCTAIPILRESGTILLQSAPAGVILIPGVLAVHELHVWRLNEEKSIASAHVVVSDPDMAKFMDRAKTISECLHAYGIHSISCGGGMCEKLACCSVSVSSDGGHE
uniref:Inorganic ion transporter n=1 Tax=Podospora anserina (strain S / ATCC MYA-4624 / DSM 980 / FGSC 10383) TaxID=515849 RepID=A0A090CPI6_PODAN|nr:Putative Inorganic ion transporter [Podospora anserina S mat+]